MIRIFVAGIVAMATAGVFIMPALSQATTPPAQTLDQRLIDAAGHFEAITEQAFTKPKQEISALLSQAEKSVSGVAAEMSADGRAAVLSAVSALKGALAEGTPSKVAINSVEAYRALVNEVSAAHPVPKEVSLLDYAGFKIRAVAQDTSVDWAEIGRTLDFADATWKVLSPRIADVGLRDAFAGSLISLRNAARAQDKAQTLQAATAELDLVDRLEAYFAKK